MRLSRRLRAPLSLAILFAASLSTPVVAQKRTAPPGEPPPSGVQVPPEEPPWNAPPGFVELQGAEADAVRGALHGYLDAVYRGDGEAAARRVTRETRGYYASMRDRAVSASAGQVRAAPLLDRLTILMLRHRVPADQLRTLTGDAVFAHAVANGWVGSNATRQPPQPVTSQVFAAGGRAVLRMWGEEVHLVREDGEWRWDMMPFLRASSTQFTPPASMTEDEFVIRILERASGRKVSPQIWNPLP